MVLKTRIVTWDVHLNKIYEYVDHKWGELRTYDENKVTIQDMVCSEFEFFFEFFKQQNYNFYIFYFDSKCKIVLNEDEIKYVKEINNLFDDSDFKEIYLSYDENFVFSKNLEFLKHNKLKYLLFLEKLNNIKFIFFIPKINSVNEFYYDLLLGFKGDHNIDEVINYQSELVFFSHYFDLKNFNLDFNFIKLFFNLDFSIFREINLFKFHYKLIRADCDNHESWPEHIEYSNYFDKKDIYKNKNSNWTDENQKELDRLSKIRSDRFYRETNHILRKKLNYRLLCFHFLYKNSQWYLEPDKLGLNIFDCFTNYHELVGSKSAYVDDSGKFIYETTPMCYPLIDALLQSRSNLGINLDLIKLEIIIDEKKL